MLIGVVGGGVIAVVVGGAVGVVIIAVAVVIGVCLWRKKPKVQQVSGCADPILARDAGPHPDSYHFPPNLLSSLPLS